MMSNQYRVDLIKLRKALARYGYELDEDVFENRGDCKE